MTNSQFINLKKAVMPFTKKYSISYIGVFGSTARGTSKKNSDIDLLFDFKKAVNFIDLIKIESKISQKMKKKVDLVTKNSIHPKLKKNIYQDLKTIYEE